MTDETAKRMDAWLREQAGAAMPTEPETRTERQAVSANAGAGTEADYSPDEAVLRGRLIRTMDDWIRAKRKG